MGRTPRDEQTLKLAVVLAKASGAIARHAEAHAVSHGLTLPEFAIIEVLYHKGDLLLGELQRRLQVTSGGITYLVDRLTEKGLVRRLECESDRRARYATLTPKGRKLIDRIFPEHVERLDHALGGLSDREREQAVKLLRTLGTHADATEPGG